MDCRGGRRYGYQAVVRVCAVYDSILQLMTVHDRTGMDLIRHYILANWVQLSGRGGYARKPPLCAVPPERPNRSVVKPPVGFATSLGQAAAGCPQTEFLLSTPYPLVEALEPCTAGSNLTMDTTKLCYFHLLREPHFGATIRKTDPLRSTIRHALHSSNPLPLPLGLSCSHPCTFWLCLFSCT